MSYGKRFKEPSEMRCPVNTRTEVTTPAIFAVSFFKKIFSDHGSFFAGIFFQVIG